MKKLKRQHSLRYATILKRGTLFDKCPEIAKDWDYLKNITITPKNISYGSRKIVHWKCHKCWYEWKDAIRNRLKGTCCKKCRSLPYKRPEMFKEFDLIRNKIKDIYTITSCSHKIFWWKCRLCGYEYKDTVKNRLRRKSNKCKYCSSLGYNNVKMSKEFDFKKNVGKTPFDFSLHARKKIYWICSLCGHHWKASISNRSKGIGCPQCSKNVILKDGTTCDSLTEAFFYLKYKQNKEKFIYNGYYPNFGKHRYDFYFPKKNKYIEVTCYDKSYKRIKIYRKTILKKKKFVEKKLKASFSFIYYHPSKIDYDFVRQNLKQRNFHKGY